jgi:hypothetical protein
VKQGIIVKNKTLKTGRLLCFGILLALMSGTASGRGELPKTTTDGLNLIESKKVDAVYWLDGATLEPYKRVLILDCHVSFEKDWQKNYNRNKVRASDQVSAEDMTRIRNELAAAFNEEFLKELQDKGGYEVVDTPAADVLILRPSIVDLQIAAPDIQSAGVVHNYVASAGAMTLYLELYDAASNAIIGRVVDAREDRQGGPIERADSFSNRIAANKMLGAWARLLREALDEAHEVNR